MNEHDEVELLDFLTRRLRIRVESGRERLDMKKVSTVDFDGGLDRSCGTNGFRL